MRPARRAWRAADGLVVHTREAAADTLRILAEEGAAEVGGVMHCFTENWEVAQAAMGLGFHISFSGIVTFKNAKDLKEVDIKLHIAFVDKQDFYNAERQLEGDQTLQLIETRDA